MPDIGQADAFVEQGSPDSMVDAIASYEAVFEVDGVPLVMDEFPDPYRSVRVRVWNTKTDDGRRTNVGGDEAAAAIELLNIALDQCKPGHPIALAYQSVGTLRLPAQCFVARLNAARGLVPNDRFIDCTWSVPLW